MMPPPGSSRPTPEAYQAFLTPRSEGGRGGRGSSESGRRVFQRLNRAEYARAVRDLLALDVDAGAWLPLDTKSANFDNIADEQALSATLLESYLNAAADISRMAVGDRNAPADRSDLHEHRATCRSIRGITLEGAPYGTRGGMVVEPRVPGRRANTSFAVDASPAGDNSRLEDIDISIDGERVALVRYENGASRRDADGRGAMPMSSRADLHQGRPAHVAARVRAPVRRSVRRSDPPARLVVRGRRLGRQPASRRCRTCAT